MRSTERGTGRPMLRLAASAGALAAALACSSGDSEPRLSPLAQQGEDTYRSVCIACHNGDPNRDGALGPAVAGASQELLTAKVVRGEYPSGYRPKRPESSAMPRFDSLADRIPGLAAYLAAVDDGAGSPQAP